MPSWCRTERFSTMRRRRRTGRSCRERAPRRRSRWTRVSRSTTRLAPASASTSRRLRQGTRPGVANDGYWGIPVKPKTRYRASFYAKAAPGFGGPVTVSIQSTDGKTSYASGTVAGLTGTWKQYELTLTDRQRRAARQARYVLGVDRPGTVWFSLVSLFPPTFKNQPNGFRADIMQMLVDMKPKFLRFPGGNYLEGDQIADRFEWKKTLGPLADRPGHVAPWGYRSSDGLGLLRVPAVVRGHGRRAAAGGLCRLLAQGSTRQSGTGPRALRAGRTRRDRVRRSGPRHRRGERGARRRATRGPSR